jgi:uncharacterized metal-binding protein
MDSKYATCAVCPYEYSERYCMREQGKGPENCPSLVHKDLKERALEALKSPDVFEFARQASLQEGAGYNNRDKGYSHISPLKPRIVELIEFAHRMKFQRLGLVFCVGLRHEAALVHNILQNNNFETVSVVCKAGRVSKQELQLEQKDHVDKTAANETMCNPILQAFVLNHYHTELNVLLGLCVGHDSLFIKYAEAFTTVLAVKDRLLGHNPLAAVYQYDSYYRYLKNQIISS